MKFSSEDISNLFEEASNQVNAQRKSRAFKAIITQAGLQ